ncbi:alpha/beta hydrolase [Cyanobacterium aponinum FACHB-4101]|uniref:alpha/beta fold hydrolase n=1 Tax=Cyanobacterium aponinum TaxID=379064 RepID=UPI001681631D|nr:alpha/beta hydrolase [Cyanobacterium aponinum]MBD2395376.1 alpha/beta hydrolase [Cyanobacterium aponinum FACHB-4101]
MEKIKIRGINHHYQFIKTQQDLTKPVLVFIHGWLLSHHYWLPLIEQIKHEYSCLTYDLKGFGLSQWDENTSVNKSEFDLSGYAQDLKILLQELAIEKAWLVGHSLGGSVALWTADICREKVTGVFCVNAGGGIYLQEEFERFRKAGENLVKFRPSWFVNVPFFDFIFSRMMVKRPLGRQWGKQRLKDFLSANEQAAIASLLKSTTEEQVHYLPQIVSRLSQPVYFIAGKQDKVMEVQYVKHLASFHQLFQQNQKNVYEIDNCGHFAMLEHTQQVKDYILEIMIEHSSQNEILAEFTPSKGQS